MIIVFAKSSSKNFSLVLSAAEGAKKFIRLDVGGADTYFACFGKDRIDAGRALTILDYVYSWKGIQCFSKGRLLTDLYRLKDVLNCYLNSQLCRDPKAHCYTIVDDPLISATRNTELCLSIRLGSSPSYKQRVEIDRYSFPCNRIFPHFRFQKDHPATIEDQIQACAVSMGCDWCPNFDADKWKKVGVTEILKDVFGS